MYEPRHPLTPAAAPATEALRVIEQAEAYFTAEKPTRAVKAAPELSPLEQMFAYYDA